MQNRENELYKRVYRGSAITSGMYSNPQNKLPSNDIGVINPNNLDTEIAVLKRGSAGQKGCGYNASLLAGARLGVLSAFSSITPTLSVQGI